MANQIAGVWRLRSAERTAHGHTSHWFGADPDGLLIFTEDLHFTEAITRTDLPAVASGDRLSTTAEEDRALARGTLGSYGTYTTNEDGSLAGQHVLGSTFPNWNDTKRGASDIRVSVADGRLRQTLRLSTDDVIDLVWEYAGTAARRPAATRSPPRGASGSPRPTPPAGPCSPSAPRGPAT